MTQLKLVSGFLDLSLVLAVGEYKLDIITDRFLKAKGIIPNTWQLAQPVSSSRHQIDLLFKNGVRITGQPGAIRLVESLVSKKIEELMIPQIAQQFLSKLPELNYRGLGINPRRYAAFPEVKDGEKQFFNERIFTPKKWQSFGENAVRPSVDLGFTLEQCLLRVNIQEAQIKIQDQQPVSAILFMGNHHYTIQGDTAEDQITCLTQAISNISNNLINYQDLIDNKFLVQESDLNSNQPVKARSFQSTSSSEDMSSKQSKQLLEA